MASPGGPPAVPSAMAMLARWYDRQMRLAPLRTNTWTAFVMGGLSNSVAQLIERKLGEFSAREMLSYGLQASPPYSHFWFMMLDRKLGPGREVVKTTLHQVVWAPLLIAYTFVTDGLLNGRSWAEVRGDLRTNLAKTIFDGWRVWPGVIFVTQKYVPALYQSSIMDVVAFFWDIYISLNLMKTRSRKKAAIPDDSDVAASTG